MSDSGFAMSMGPGGNQWCCGKPFGCTSTLGLNPGDVGSCSFLNHKWKLDNIAGHRERMAAFRASQRAAEADPEGS